MHGVQVYFHLKFKLTSNRENVQNSRQKSLPKELMGVATFCAKALIGRVQWRREAKMEGD